MKFTFKTLIKDLIAKHVGPNCEFQTVSIDTRTLRKGDVFIAIKGPNFDGHHFIDAAKDKGAVGVIVSREVKTDLPQLIVENTEMALIALASLRRAQFKGKVIGITGSCGKTTVKSLTAALLAQKGKTQATQASYNNHLGVPLTLLQLEDDTEYAVVEMGANHAGEIALLTTLAKPDIATITLVAPVHLEGFLTLQGIADAKAEIFMGLPSGGTALLNRDDNYYDHWHNMLLADRRRKLTIKTFGLHKDALVRASNVTLTDKGTVQFNLHLNSQKERLLLPLMGEHHVMNALVSVAIADCMGVSFTTMMDALQTIVPEAHRMVSVAGKKGADIIDDCYNANPTAVSASMKFLSKLSKEKVFVFGDMAECGSQAAKFHQSVGKEAKKLGIKQLITLGEYAEKAASEFGENAKHFTDEQALIDYLKQQLHNNLTVLVKGSRAMKLERVVDAIKVS